MKIIDMQAAIGVEQLRKLPDFVEKRKKNYALFAAKLKEYSRYLDVIEAAEGSDPCWFAVPFAVKEDAPFSRKDMASFLETRKIETRPLLGGNMELQPAYRDMTFRKSTLDVTNHFHKNGLFIGCNPALTEDMKRYVLESLDAFFSSL